MVLYIGKREVKLFLMKSSLEIINKNYLGKKMFGNYLQKRAVHFFL